MNRQTTAKSATPTVDQMALTAREYVTKGADFVSLADARRLEAALREIRELSKDAGVIIRMKRINSICEEALKPTA